MLVRIGARKRKSIKRFVVFSAAFTGVCIIGATGNILLNNATDGRAPEQFILDKISGKDEVVQEYKIERQIYLSELEKLKNENHNMRIELVSRGEIERVEKLKKEKVIKAIANNLKGKFHGYAEDIYNEGKEHNVNPMLLAAIMKHETANGSSDVCVNADNPGGINWWEGCGYPRYGWYIDYPNLKKGIEEMAKLLKTNYIDLGLADIYSIGAKYAPVSDKRNGLYGMDNSKWPLFVERNYQKIYEEAK